MNKQLEYKGFVGTVEYCDTDNIFHGKVIGLPNTLINYHGDTMQSLYDDFVEAVNFHLECEDIPVPIFTHVVEQAIV